MESKKSGENSLEDGDDRVAVVLSTYNGEVFLPELLDSLKKQDHSVHVVVRDDGSMDKTVDILHDFKEIVPGCELIEGTNLGVVGSFSWLLNHVVDRFDYIALCDQDDVWYPDKISKTLKVLRQAEELHGRQTPILVHTDLQVVDAEMRLIAPSFWKAQHLGVNGNIKLNQLLTQNVVTGCSVMMNAALLKEALPISGAAMMHDWWLALCAALKGQIVSLPEPTIYYRQHGTNLVGSRSYTLGYAIKQLSDLAGVRRRFEETTRQAQALCHHFNGSLSNQEKNLIASYAALPYQSRLQRIRHILAGRYYKRGFRRNIGVLMALLTLAVGRRAETL